MASFGVFVDMGFERRGFLPNRLLPEEAGVEGLWGSGFMVEGLGCGTGWDSKPPKCAEYGFGTLFCRPKALTRKIFCFADGPKVS